MEPAVHRSRAPRLRLWPGTERLVGVCPLARSSMDEAALRVDELWRAWGVPAGGGIYHQALQRAVLERALCAPEPPHDPIGQLDTSPTLLDALWELWEGVQLEHWPDIEQLDRDTERQMAWAEIDAQAAEAARLTGYPPPPAHDVPLAVEALAAATAEVPTDFYGEPAIALTDAQLAYWLTLRAVHRRVTDPEKKKRCISVNSLG